MRLVLGGGLILVALTAGWAIPHAGAAADKAAAAKPADIITPEAVGQMVGKHKGRVTLLHLWATWCAPCLEELPIMGELARTYRSKGVDVVSVSLDDATPEAAAKVTSLINEKAGGALTTAIVKVTDPDAFITGIDPRWQGTIPALFAYDRKGNLRKAMVGESTRAQIEALFRDMLKGN